MTVPPEADSSTAVAIAQEPMITLEADGTYTVVRSHTYEQPDRYGIRANAACGSSGACTADTNPRPLLLAWQPELGDPGGGVLTGHSPELGAGVELAVAFPDGATLAAVSEPGGVVVFGEHVLPGGQHDVSVVDADGGWVGDLTIEVPAAADAEAPGEAAPAKESRPRKTSRRRPSPG